MDMNKHFEEMQKKMEDSKKLVEMER